MIQVDHIDDQITERIKNAINTDGDDNDSTSMPRMTIPVPPSELNQEQNGNGCCLRGKENSLSMIHKKNIHRSFQIWVKTAVTSHKPIEKGITIVIPLRIITAINENRAYSSKYQYP